MVKTFPPASLSEIVANSQPIKSLAPSEKPLSRQQLLLEQQLKPATKEVGPYTMVCARAANEEIAQQILQFCDVKKYDCMLLCGQRLYIEGQSSVINQIKSDFGKTIETDNGTIYADKNYVDLSVNTDMKKTARSLSAKYYNATLWDMAQQAGFHNLGRVVATYLPNDMKQHAANVAKTINDTDMPNPVLMSGVVGGRMQVFMSATSREGMIMAAKYAQCVQPSTEPGVNMFTFDGQQNVEAFLDDANQVGQQVFEQRQQETAQRVKVQNMLEKCNIKQYEGIVAAHIPGLTKEHAATAVQEMTRYVPNQPNAFAAYNVGQKFEVAFDTTNTLGQRMLELYSDQHGPSSHDINTGILRFDTKDELKAFIRDANAQSVAIARGMNQRELDAIHIGMTNATKVGNVVAVTVEAGKCDMTQLCTTISKIMPNAIVVEKGPQTTNLHISAKSELGRHMASQVLRPTAYGFDVNQFSMNSNSAVNAFFDKANQFLEPQRDDITAEGPNNDEMNIE